MVWLTASCNVWPSPEAAVAEVEKWPGEKRVRLVWGFIGPEVPMADDSSDDSNPHFKVVRPPPPALTREDYRRADEALDRMSRFQWREALVIAVVATIAAVAGVMAVLVAMDVL